MSRDEAGTNGIHSTATGKKLNRRTLIKGAAAAGASAAAVGATTKASKVFAAPLVQSKPTEVTFWTSHTEPDLTSIKNIVNDFNKANPDIHVTVTLVVGNETDVAKLMTAVRGGTGPDVYELDRFTIAQRASDGVIEDLSKLVDNEQNKKDYLGFAWAETQYNEKPYGLPLDTDARAIYYNKTLLKDAGVDITALDASKGPITFDDIATMAHKVDKKDANGNYTQVGFVPYFSQGWHYTYGFAMGGKFFDPATCKVTPTDPGVVKAFDWVNSWAKEADPTKLYAFIQNAMREQAPTQSDPFLQKRMAFELTGDWMLNNIATYAKDIDFGITYIPVLKQGDTSVTWSGGWSTVIPTGAKQPEAGIKFMQYYCGEAGQKTYTLQTKHMPTLLSLLSDDSLFQGEHLFFKNLLPHSKNRPVLPVGALYWDQLTTAWKQAYFNQGSTNSNLEAVYNAVQPRLQRFCPLKEAS